MYSRSSNRSRREGTVSTLVVTVLFTYWGKLLSDMTLDVAFRLLLALISSLRFAHYLLSWDILIF